ncbi:hypothetical protein BH11BAC2_BH11BAC2_06090 [soil metagenome]
MRRYLFILICLLSIKSYGQKTVYHRATIFLNGNSVTNLAAAGIDITEGVYQKGISFTSDFSERELQQIKKSGFRYTIDINDVSSYYKNQSNTSVNKITAGNCNSISPVYSTPTNFHLGSMGGYFTYAEMLQILDSMALLYPNLITVKHGLPGGTSIEGDSILWVKISDNPNIDELEPEVLYTALHHAREPGGMSTLIYYMWYLLENYSSDISIQQLVDATEMYFVPCVNPDGYQWNEFTDPNGGGLWRKNRRDNLDGTFGTDLNRNYGYLWGYDDNGSSPSTASDVYRGTAAFSEPETQLIRDFVNTHSFKTALNYHTYGNLLVYPFGPIPGLLTPDSVQYITYGKLLTQFNNFNAGTPDQTVGYVVNGNSDDWMYGDQVAKPKVFAFTPEVGDGAFGFWPPATEIVSICNMNVFPNLLSAKLAGPFAYVSLTGQNNITSTNPFIHYNLNQIGVDTTGTYIITFTGISANVLSTGAPKNYSGLTALQQLSDSMQLNLSPSIQNGDTVVVLISVNNGLYTESDTVTLTYGNYATIFNDPGTTITNWTAVGGWGISSNYFVSPPSSITDSPFGNYPNNSNKIITLTSNLNLTNALQAQLSFNARWMIEDTYDFCILEISTNNGSTWTSLCGNYTKLTTNANAYLQPVYDGFQNSWVFESINLDDYCGQSIKLRFRMFADGFGNFDGFYFDDLNIAVVTPTGLQQINPLEENNSIYPNPASDKIVFTTSTDNVFKTLLIYAHTGQLKDKIEFTSELKQVDVESYADGLYTYQITDDKGNHKTGRFIVSH